jgi:hypothetical protein
MLARVRDREREREEEADGNIAENARKCRFICSEICLPGFFSSLLKMNMIYSLLNVQFYFFIPHIPNRHENTKNAAASLVRHNAKIMLLAILQLVRCDNGNVCVCVYGNFYIICRFAE